MHASRPIRKSLKRREVVGGIRFLTFSCQRRLPLLSNPDIARVFVESLGSTKQRSGFELFAWVVMPEHVHLLVQPPVSNDGVQSPLSPILKGLKSSVARRVLARWAALEAPILSRIDDGKGHPRFWQKGGGFDRNVRDQREFCKTVQYIHRNPVERGLVERCEQWEWSSVRWWLGRRDGVVGCDPPPGDQKAWRAWKGFM